MRASGRTCATTGKSQISFCFSPNWDLPSLQIHICLPTLVSGRSATDFVSRFQTSTVLKSLLTERSEIKPPQSAFLTLLTPLSLPVIHTYITTIEDHNTTLSVLPSVGKGELKHLQAQSPRSASRQEQETSAAAMATFQKLNDTWEVLKDDRRRRTYSALRATTSATRIAAVAGEKRKTAKERACLEEEADQQATTRSLRRRARNALSWARPNTTRS